MSTTEYPAWEKVLDAWEAKYVPMQNLFDSNAGDKFETYGEELEHVLAVANSEPKRVWTLVEGDGGDLYIVNGYHLVNRLNYFITAKPFDGEFLEVPYYIFDESEEDEDE